MVIETVRPFHFRDLGNWTVEQGALWAVVELSLTYSPSFQENNGIPQPERLVVIPYLPTLAIFEEACLALVQSTIRLLHLVGLSVCFACFSYVLCPRPLLCLP